MVITELIESSCKNMYLIELELIKGDFDEWYKKQIQIPEEREDLVQELIEILREMTILHYEEAREQYNRIPGFLKWFSDMERGERQDYSFIWKHTELDDYFTLLGDFEVYYFDDKGSKNRVLI